MSCLYEPFMQRKIFFGIICDSSKTLNHTEHFDTGEAKKSMISFNLALTL